MTLPAVRVHAETHRGLLHPRNEDAFAVQPTADGLLLAVCDGMGGMGRADEASRIALLAVLEVFGDASPSESVRRRLDRALTTADERVRAALCDARGRRAGSTAVVAFLTGDEVHVAWVGDSRAYQFRGEAAIRRTRDHKLVEDLVDAGELSREEARISSLSNVVTRAVGGRSPVAPPVEVEHVDAPWQLLPGDRILLCSDGLTDLVRDADLGAAVADRAPKEAVIDLVRTALARGGHDNVTVVLAAWEGPRGAEPPEVRIGTAGHVIRADGTAVASEVDDSDLPLPPDRPDDWRGALASTAELAPLRRRRPDGDRAQRLLLTLAFVLFALAAAFYAVRAVVGST